MNRIERLAAVLFHVLVMVATTACAAFAQSDPPRTVVIGYLDLADDPRYEPLRLNQRIILKDRPRPYAGAEMAVGEAQTLARVARIGISIEQMTAPAAEDLPRMMLTAHKDKGIGFFLVDAPEGLWPVLADAARGQNVLLFNVSAKDDALRRQLCRREIIHTVPSRAMLMDALVQHLVSRKWREFLVIEGTHREDGSEAAAFVASAKKFGARIVAHQRMKPGRDPRDREQNNPALITAVGRDYDIVFVADRELEFARELPYRMARPRPVVGSIDLEPVAWHWSSERHGAPQVNSRFSSATRGRRMESADWAAWIAVKMIAQAATRVPKGDFAKLRATIFDEAGFDGSKGLAVSARRWDQQLRQPILLATPLAVVASAPVEGFLHQINRLDTLGDDAQESPCRLDRAG